MISSGGTGRPTEDSLRDEPMRRLLLPEACRLCLSVCGELVTTVREGLI
jgi:hypothetical protein